MHRVSIGLLALALSLPAADAFAQDVSTAKAMFDKGVQDMEAGKFESGCPALQESYRLDPRPGTLFTLAECFAKGGKTASAVARYEDYLNVFSRMTPEEQGKQHGRDQTAHEQHDKLKPHVPQLTLRLENGAPGDASVIRDGETLGRAVLGVSLPLDPGKHTIVTQAPGGSATTTTVDLAPDDKKDLTLKVAPPQAGASIGPGANVPPHSGPGTQPGTAEPDTRGDTQRIAGIALMGVGGAGLLVGAITGGLALGAKSTVTSNCNLTTKICNATGLDKVQSAQTEGLVSTIGFVAGGALAVAGLVTYFVAPKHAAAAKVGLTFGAAPLPHGGGAASLGVSGAF